MERVDPQHLQELAMGDSINFTDFFALPVDVLVLAGPDLLID
jgi:hypothetical protein